MGILERFGLLPKVRYSRAEVCDALRQAGCRPSAQQEPDLTIEFWNTRNGKEFHIPADPRAFSEVLTFRILQAVERLQGPR
ncbi:MAG: hypothetical protein HQL40_14490 [Alphaproteobacteria bacterium]|nr:hypothetical protein [Alphaproteobacteria bacterium]